MLPLLLADGAFGSPEREAFRKDLLSRPTILRTSRPGRTSYLFEGAGPGEGGRDRGPPRSRLRAREKFSKCPRRTMLLRTWGKMRIRANLPASGGLEARLADVVVEAVLPRLPEEDGAVAAAVDADDDGGLRVVSLDAGSDDPEPLDR